MPNPNNTAKSYAARTQGINPISDQFENVQSDGSGSLCVNVKGGSFTANVNSQTVYVEGQADDGQSSTANTVIIGGIDLLGKVRAATVQTLGSFNATVVVPIDAVGSPIVVLSNRLLVSGGGEKTEDAVAASGDTGVFMLGVRNDSATATLTNANGDYSPLAVDGQGRQYINPGTLVQFASGPTAHDASSTAEGPVKVGSVAIDYTPDTEGEQGNTSVAATDMAQFATNLKGEVVEGVKAEYQDLAELDHTFNTATESLLSSDYPCWQYRMATLAYTIKNTTGTPTDLTLSVEASVDGTTAVFYQVMWGPLANLIYARASVNGSTGISRSIEFPIAFQRIRVKIATTGTATGATFETQDVMLSFRN